MVGKCDETGAPPLLFPQWLNHMSKNEISVIVPCYNAEIFLDAALQAISGQTVTPLEIILVDDGSTIPVSTPRGWDGPPLRIIRTPNRGLAAARNMGISNATGRYLAFLDADDHWEPRKLELQQQALEADLSASTCYTRCVDAPGYFAFGPYPPLDISNDALFLMLWYHSFFPPSSVMIRKSALDLSGSFREGMLNGEDVELFFRLLKIGRFVQVPTALTYYRQHEGQFTKNLYKKFIGGRQARRVMIELHGERMIQAGLRPDKLWDAHRHEILLLYYRRHFEAARKLLWGYWREHPSDLGLLFKAVVSLLPPGLVTRLRGRLADRPPSGAAVTPEEANRQGWERLVAALAPVLRPGVRL